MKDRYNIDDWLSDKLTGEDPEVPQGMWDRVENTLDRNVRKKRLFWWLSAAAVVAIAGVFAISNYDSTVPEGTETVRQENNQIEKDNSAYKIPQERNEQGKTDQTGSTEDNATHDMDNRSNESGTSASDAAASRQVKGSSTKDRSAKDDIRGSDSEQDGNIIDKGDNEKIASQEGDQVDGNEQKDQNDNSQDPVPNKIDKIVQSDEANDNVNSEGTPDKTNEPEEDPDVIAEQSPEQSPVTPPKENKGKGKDNSLDPDKKRNWGLNFSFSPTLLMKNVSIRDGYENYVHRDFKSTFRSQEKNHLNQSIGLSLNYTPTNSRFTFYGGVSMAFLGAKRDYNYRYQLAGEDGTNLDPTGNPTIFGYFAQYKDVNESSNNKFTYLELPLSVSYRIPIGMTSRWSFEPKFGISYMKLIEISGKEINQGNMDLKEIAKNNYRNSNFGILSTAGLYYSTGTTGRFKIGVEPYYHYMVRNAEKDYVTIRTRTNGFGLNIGVNYVLF